MKTILRVLFSKNIGRFILLGSSATITISLIATLVGLDGLLYAAVGAVLMIGYIIAGVRYEQNRCG